MAEQCYPGIRIIKYKTRHSVLAKFAKQYYENIKGFAINFSLAELMCYIFPDGPEETAQ